ncbi:uncharacterized protein LOC124648222 [Lolium rigidum]|uniref:uncharacterized protein LOC124648222 n=1 Tax=Lolium rigidum TaxID=89674 RepID=UPI001F5C6981|nr:uncharacterized protein LOC124648222 [Lolium rigidum]
MGMESGCASPRKRKFEALQVPRLAAAELPSPKDVVEGQEPPLPRANGFVGDRISQLPDDVLGDIISLLPTKEGPGRYFSAPMYHLQATTADVWLRSPALDNLQELELCSFEERLPNPPPTLQPLPAAAFRFSETLLVATIGDYHFPDDTVEALHFPKLKKLAFQRSFGFRCVRINSITLKSIGVCDSYEKRGIEFKELIIENAPRLERLLQGLHVDSLATAVHTIKILSVDMHTLSLGVVINLMRCFPCLEKLYIESRGPGETNLWRRKHRDLIRSLDIRVKKISWHYYRGIKSHVDFATFFVLNAKVLELMTLEVHEDDYNEEFIAEQRRKLQLDSKVSRGARFHFTPEWSHHSSWCFRVHDLDLADPFERKEPYKFRE